MSKYIRLVSQSKDFEEDQLHLRAKNDQISTMSKVVVFLRKVPNEKRKTNDRICSAHQSRN